MEYTIAGVAEQGLAALNAGITDQPKAGKKTMIVNRRVENEHKKRWLITHPHCHPKGSG